jgi:hypothetical protein
LFLDLQVNQDGPRTLPAPRARTLLRCELPHGHAFARHPARALRPIMTTRGRADSLAIWRQRPEKSASAGGE